MRLDSLLAGVEQKANHCLVATPTPDHVRDFARDVIDLVDRLRRGEHPYRSNLPEPNTGEAAALVSLERALDECQQKLASAEAEIARLSEKK